MPEKNGPTRPIRIRAATVDDFTALRSMFLPPDGLAREHVVAGAHSARFATDWPPLGMATVWPEPEVTMVAVDDDDRLLGASWMGKVPIGDGLSGEVHPDVAGIVTLVFAKSSSEETVRGLEDYVQDAARQLGIKRLRTQDFLDEAATERYRKRGWRVIKSEIFASVLVLDL